MNNCRRYEKRKIINTILEDHFDEFKKSELKRLKNKEMREHITEVVEKSLTCGKIEYGYVKYRCLICNEEYIHGFSCKSKFCTRCGRMYSISWAEKQASNMLKVKHRHALFTEARIDKERKWFKK